MTILAVVPAEQLDYVVPASFQCQPEQAWQKERRSTRDLVGSEDFLLLWSRGEDTPQITLYSAKVVSTAALLGSAVSFGLAAVWFGVLGSSPAPDEGPPEGYHCWECCNCTLRQDVTALGQSVYPQQVLAVAAYPRLILGSLLLSILYALLFTESRQWLTWAAAPVQLLLNMVLLIVALSPSSSMRRDDSVERAASVGHYAVFVIVLAVLKPVRDGEQRPSCGHSLLVGFGLLLGVFTRIVLFFLIDKGPLNHVNPGLNYMLALLLHRTLDASLRLLVKHMNVSSTFCSLLMLHLQIQGCTVLRAYAMSMEWHDLIMAGAAQCTLEVMFSVTGLVLVSYRFNRISEREGEQGALRLVELCVRGIHSDMLSELLALNTSLAHALFLDRRLMETKFRGSPAVALQNWGAMLGFELMADLVVLLVVLGRIKTEALPQYPFNKAYLNFPHAVNYPNLSCLDVC